MKKDNRSAILRVRVTPEESEVILRSSEEADLSVSAYLRKRVLGHRVESTCDLRMLAELSRIGGMCRQLWKENRREEARTIWAGLDNLRKTIEAANDR